MTPEPKFKEPNMHFESIGPKWHNETSLRTDHVFYSFYKLMKKYVYIQNKLYEHIKQIIDEEQTFTKEKEVNI
jgi:hypothetical protein